MNVTALWHYPRLQLRLPLGFPLLLLALALPGLARPLSGAEPAAAGEKTGAAADDAADSDDIVSLAAYNVQADRVEDFGIGAMDTFYPRQPKSGMSALFSKFAPIVVAVRPNTAAARAGLQPGEFIVKSEGRSTVGGGFSSGKTSAWYTTQRKKWDEVASGQKDVTWTLEVENPVTKAVRTVKLVVPTPPPHWGSSVWHSPQGRQPSNVAEPGPLAERARTVLDHGILTWVHDGFFQQFLNPAAKLASEPTGYDWTIGGARENGQHRIFVTQFRGRTDVVLEAFSAATGRWVYLTSPSGALERAWRYTRQKKGEVSLAEARAGFEHELDLWTTKVGKVSARWPLELKPGYDANAIFATLAPKGAKPAVVRPLAESFLKLPSASEAEKALFTTAYGRLGTEANLWAYTETSRGLEDKRVLVTRVDPSQPEASRSVLVSIDGKPPKPADVQRWRDEGGDVPKSLGDLPPLESLVDLRDIRVVRDDTASMVFEVPLRDGNADFPAEKFQAQFRVNKTHRALEDVTVKLRESFRIAGVVKVTDAGLELHFQTLDPTLAPQPVQLKAGGGVRVLLVKVSRAFEATRTDFKRVQPYVDPEAVGAAPAK